MLKVIQVKLEPKSSQITLLNSLLEEHRELYNSTLECKKILYEEFDQQLSCFDAIKSVLPEFKKSEKLKLANYSSAQQTIRRLDKAFNKFFHGIRNGENVGYPRFKGKNQFSTIEFGKYGDGCKIKKDQLYIQRIGLIKCLWFSKIENIRTLSITKRNDSFYVNFIIEEESPKINPTNNKIGVDFGVKTFITTSNGDKYESPKYLKKSLKRVGKAHRKISKTELKSKDREKAKKILNKVQTKISNQRKDFNHKLSRKIINENDIIVIEDININQLKQKNSIQNKDQKIKKENINRTYDDMAWGQFTQFLKYKAENAGKILIKVPAYNTTKECHVCGKLINKTLNERVHKCSCGCIEDRDINAAKVILRRGLASLEKS